MVMSQIAMELEEKATELGFQSLQQALDAGCEVEYGPAGQSELVEPLVAAHRAWEAEKIVLIKGLDRVADRMGNGIEPEDLDLIEHAKQFIKEAHE